ncbi:MAG: ATP-binding protein [Elusimicrobia bacterium]|nr:ATP-binding protein [Elusimicrobiota bacterium]
MLNRIIELPGKASFFLFGPRQTGKSTLIKQRWPEDVWTIDLLHTDEQVKYSKEPALLRRQAKNKIAKGGVKTVFIDEIQKVPALLDEVQALMAEFPACRFILTGSSARKLRRGAANLLAGRLRQRFLFPFVHQEIACDFDLEQVLRFGSLPAVYGKSDEEKTDILKAYAQTYLKEEIQSEGIARNLGGFSRFLDVAAAQCGDLVNFSAIGREAQLATRTVQSYYEIIEDTLIGLRLEGWRKSPRKRLSVHPKFYLFDLGVTNAINRRLAADPDPVTRGRLFEQWIILETHRLLAYKNSESRLFYWRTNNGAEVDLLIERGGKILAACEIKSSKHVSGADLSGLRAFKEDYPKTPLYVITNDDHAYRLGEARVLSWKDYFEMVRADKEI